MSLEGSAVGGASPAAYWESRARRFAARGRGLAAVCSYGMPAFYNAAIDLGQRLALRPWLRPAAGLRVLDVGCGVGRWSCLLAARGARVTGVDLSPQMISVARRSAAARGVSCRFLVGDVTALELGAEFDLVLGVTVLQHLVSDAELDRALARLVRRLAPGGRLVLLEAAPERERRSCDTTHFRARTAARYRSAFRDAGLEVEAVAGVDPAPFKLWLLPRYAGLPRVARTILLALATAASLPFDLALGRRLAGASWHKVFVLRRRTVR